MEDGYTIIFRRVFPFPVGNTNIAVLLVIFATSPFTKLLSDVPETDPELEMVSKLEDEVVNIPLVKLTFPLAVQAAVRVTPLDVLIVRLLSTEVDDGSSLPEEIGLVYSL